MNSVKNETLRNRVLAVLTALPKDVQRGFLQDSRFTVSLDNYTPERGSTVFMAVPGSTGSRNVVLKPRLGECSENFALYVIAHEFAHAYLWNGPWGKITDVEEAADALAAKWGFHRPDGWPPARSS